jgi:isopentenyl diphosphate isomerase/L-lactate dehydrogenase-like FMN-dependent dehydrogenase
MSITVMGQKTDMPLFCAPTALQRLFHHDGERAVAKAAQKFGTMFGISSLGTISIEEIGSTISTPKLFQLYFHKDRGLTNSMIERCIAANFDVLALTVDTITGGNRERDLRTGFTSPPRPELPTMAEAGVPGYEVSSWHGLFLPAKTPPEIVSKMSVDTVAALADPVVKGKLEQAGYMVVGSSPGELQTLLKSEIGKWSAVIKTVGIKIN